MTKSAPVIYLAWTVKKSLQVVAEKGFPFQLKLPKQAASEHETWFRQQVHVAIEDADKPATVFIPL